MNRWKMQRQSELNMVGIGELLWDLLPQGKQLGGAPANFAYHSQQLGNRGFVVSSVGKDPLGAEILQVLQEKQINCLVTEVVDFPTGTVAVSMDGEGVPTYTIQEETAWDHLQLDERHKELAARADVVCYGSLAQRSTDTASAIFQFLDWTSPDCLHLLDVNLRQNYYSVEILEKLLQSADLVKLNDEELIVIADYFDLYGGETDILSALEDLFALELLILTKGADGSRLYSQRHGDSIFNGVNLGIVDTVGAGDSFTAAVVSGITRNMSLQQTHLLATRVAAHVCQQAGAMPPMPSADKLWPNTPNEG